MIWMCSLSLLYLPVNGYTHEKCSCLPPILQHTSRPIRASYNKYYMESLRRHWASNNHGVRFMMGHARPNTKSTYGREGLTSHFTITAENRRMCVCAIMPCMEALFKAREFPPGCWHCMYGYINYCIATQPADYNNYLISKVCVYYLKKFPDATYRYQMIEIHTQRDGMWFTHAPKCFGWQGWF